MDHHSQSGGFEADVWYDRSDTWAGLAFDRVDGFNLHYERLQVGREGNVSPCPCVARPVVPSSAA